MDKLIQKAKKIISDNLYITLATASSDGQPWSSPLYSAFDNKYNFYWVSPVKTQHIKNIKENSQVFITIFDSHAPAGTGEGIYIKAEASEVKGLKETLHALKTLYARKKKSPRDISYFLKKSPLRFYKAVPGKIWINTYEKIGEHNVDGRVEIKLI